MNSSHYPSCKGCKHVTDTTHEWCYMFDKKMPGVDTCAQHSAFIDNRKSTSTLYLYKVLCLAHDDTMEPEARINEIKDCVALFKESNG